MGRLPVTKAKSIEELLKANLAALRDLACEDEETHYKFGSELILHRAIRYRFGADLLEDLLAIYQSGDCGSAVVCDVRFDADAFIAKLRAKMAEPAEAATVRVDQPPYSPRPDIDGPLDALPVTEAGSLKELLAANIAAFDEHVEKQTQRFVDSPQSWRREDIVRIRFAAEILRKLLPLA